MGQLLSEFRYGPSGVMGEVAKGAAPGSDFVEHTSTSIRRKSIESACNREDISRKGPQSLSELLEGLRFVTATISGSCGCGGCIIAHWVYFLVAVVRERAAGAAAPGWSTARARLLASARRRAS